MFITPDYKRNHVIFLVNNVLEKTSQRVKGIKGFLSVGTIKIPSDPNFVA